MILPIKNPQIPQKSEKPPRKPPKSDAENGTKQPASTALTRSPLEPRVACGVGAEMNSIRATPAAASAANFQFRDILEGKAVNTPPCAPGDADMQQLLAPPMLLDYSNELELGRFCELQTAFWGRRLCLAAEARCGVST